MIKKNVLIMAICFALAGVTPTANAFYVSPTAKIVGGGLVAAAGIAGTWRCLKQRQDYVKQIEELKDASFDGKVDAETLQELESGKWWHGLFAGISGCTALAGVGVVALGAVEWSQKNSYFVDGDLVVDSPVKLTKKFSLVLDEDGTYSLQRPIKGKQRTLYEIDEDAVADSMRFFGVNKKNREEDDDEKEEDGEIEIDEKFILKLMIENSLEISEEIGGMFIPAIPRKAINECKRTFAKLENNQELNRMDKFVLALAHKVYTKFTPIKDEYDSDSDDDD